MKLLVSIPLLTARLVTCDGGGSLPPPDGAPPDTAPPAGATIHLTALTPPGLVLFRDGVTADWQPATMITPTTFEAMVTGPYVVAVGCDEDFGSVSRQFARTPDDSHDLDLLCGAAVGTSKVTGTMAQPGQIAFGPFGESFGGTMPWSFEFDVSDGDYALFAATDDQIAVRRHVAVHGDTVITPDVDVAAEGVALAPTAFTAPNATATETLSASVLAGPSDPTTDSIELYQGNIATAKVAPQSVLTTDDLQTVSIEATDQDMHRALQRPFGVGDDTAFTLPDRLGAVQWAIDNGQLGVSWADTRPGDDLFANTAGFGSDDPHHLRAYTLSATESFLVATKIMRLSFATDLPGYQDRWKIDFQSRYNRRIVFGSSANHVDRTVWNEASFNDDMAAAPAVALPSARSLGARVR